MPTYHTLKTVFVHIPKTGGSTISTILRRPNLRSLTKHEPCQTINKHASIFVHLDELGPEAKNYFKFSFVRNPWDRLVSAYHYIIARRKELELVANHSTFESFLHSFVEEPSQYLSIPYFTPQSDFLINEDGEMPIDFLGRFETFEKDLSIVLREVGSKRRFFKHRKKSRRQDYREYYSTESSKAVGAIYISDIQNFGYDFNDGLIRQKQFSLRKL
ncbi:sulfotransferase family 2 domain-containing protein [Ruegeria atlantica]|uniref:sulfotransferase family 2 domain-containing protein n=1 Tax=Ruegeria atlantica TaxID=81569 RepID=UPI00147E1D1B|nr:sulfotransferase family 2 domain-containing protein [Ruegeria atlantica]